MASEAGGEQPNLERLQDNLGDSINYSSLSLPNCKEEFLNLKDHEGNANINGDETISVPSLDFNRIETEQCCVSGPCACSEGEVLVETPTRVQGLLPDVNNGSDYIGESLKRHVVNRNNEGNVDKEKNNNQVETCEDMNEATRDHNTTVLSVDELHTEETDEVITNLSGSGNDISKYEGKYTRNYEDLTSLQLKDEIEIEERKSEDVEETLGLLVQDTAGAQHKYGEMEHEDFGRKDDEILAKACEYQDNEEAIEVGSSSDEDHINDANELLVTETLQREGKKEDSLLNAESHIEPKKGSINDGISNSDAEKKVTEVSAESYTHNNIGDTETKDDPGDTSNEIDNNCKESTRHTSFVTNTNKPTYEEDDDAKVTTDMENSQDLEDSLEKVDKTASLDQVGSSIDGNTIVTGDKELSQTQETVISNTEQKEKEEIYRAEELTDTYEESVCILSRDSPIEDISEDDVIEGTHHEEEVKAESLAGVAAGMKQEEANNESTYEDDEISRSVINEEAFKLMVKDDLEKNEKDALVLPIVHETFDKESMNDTIKEEKLAVYEENEELGNGVLDISCGNDKPQVGPTDIETDINTVMVDDKYIKENVNSSIDVVSEKHDTPNINEEELVDENSNHDTESSEHEDKGNKVEVEARTTKDGCHINEDEEISRSVIDEQAFKLMVKGDQEKTEKDALVLPIVHETFDKESVNDTIKEEKLGVYEENEELGNNVPDISCGNDKPQVGPTDIETDINTVMLDDKYIKENVDSSIDVVSEKHDTPNINEEELMDENSNHDTESSVHEDKGNKVEVEARTTKDGCHINEDEEISLSGKEEEEEASKLLVSKDELILPKTHETIRQEPADDLVFVEEKQLMREEKNEELSNNLVDSSSDKPQIGQTDTETHEIMSSKVMDDKKINMNLDDCTDAVGENSNASNINQDLMDQNTKDNRESDVHKNEDHNVGVEIAPTGDGDEENLDDSTDAVGENNDAPSSIEKPMDKNTKDNTESDVHKNEDHKIEFEIAPTGDGDEETLDYSTNAVGENNDAPSSIEDLVDKNTKDNRESYVQKSEDHKVEVETTPTGDGDKESLDDSTDAVGENNDAPSIIEELMGQDTKDNTEPDVHKNEDHKVDEIIVTGDGDHINADKEISRSGIDENEMEKNENDSLVLAKVQEETIATESGDDSGFIEEKEPGYEEKNEELGNKTLDMPYDDDNNQGGPTDIEISNPTPANTMDDKCIKKSYDDYIDAVGETLETPNINEEEWTAQDKIESDVHKDEDHSVEVEVAPVAHGDHINDDEEIPKSDIDEGPSQLMFEDDVKNENDALSNVHETITKESADDSVLVKDEQAVSEEKNDQLGNDVVDLSYGGGKTQVGPTESEICDTTSLERDDRSIKESFDDSADAVGEKHGAHNINEKEKMDQNSKSNMESVVHKDKNHNAAVGVAEARNGDLINENEEISTDIEEENTSTLIVDDLEKDPLVLTEAIAKRSEDGSDLVDEEEIPACEEKNKKLGNDVDDFPYDDDKPQVESTKAETCDATSLKMVDDKSKGDSSDAVGEKNDAPNINEEEQMNQNIKSNTESDVNKNEDHNVAVEVAEVNHGNLIENEEISRTGIDEDNASKLIVEDDQEKNEMDSLSLMKIQEAIAKESVDDFVLVDEEEIPAYEEKMGNNDAVDFSYGDKKLQVGSTDTEISNIIFAKSLDDKHIKENIDDHGDAVSEKQDAANINEEEQMGQSSKCNIESDEHKDNKVTDEDLINDDEEISRSDINEEEDSKMIAKDDMEKNEKDAPDLTKVHETIAKKSAHDSVLIGKEKHTVDGEKNEELGNNMVDLSYGDVRSQIQPTNIETSDTTFSKAVDNENINFDDSTGVAGEKHDSLDMSEEEQMDQNRSHNTGSDVDNDEDNKVAVDVKPNSHGYHINEDEEVGPNDTETHDTRSSRTVDSNNIEENYNDSISAVGEKNDAPNTYEEEKIGKISDDIIELDMHEDEYHKVEAKDAPTNSRDGNADEEISTSDIDEEAAPKVMLHDDLEMSENDAFVLADVHGTVTKDFADERETIEEKQLAYKEKNGEFNLSYSDDKLQVGQSNTDTHDSISAKKVFEKNIENIDDCIDAVNEMNDTLSISEEESLGQDSKDRESETHKNEDRKAEVEVAPTGSGDHNNEDKISTNGEEGASTLTAKDDLEKNEKHALTPGVSEMIDKEPADDLVDVNDEKQSAYTEKKEEFDLPYSDEKFQVGQTDTETQDIVSAETVDDNNIEENFNDSTDAVDEENNAPSINEEERKGQNFKDNIESDLHKDEDHKIEVAVALAGSVYQINEDEENSMAEINEEDTSKLMTQDNLEKNQKDAFVIPEVCATITKETADDPVHSEERQSVDQEKKEDDFSYGDDRHQAGQTNTEIHNTISAKIVDDNNIDENFKDSIDSPNINDKERMGQHSKESIESGEQKDEDHKMETEVAPTGSGDHNNEDKISTICEEDTSKLMTQDDLEKNEKDALSHEVSETITKEPADDLADVDEEKQAVYEEKKEESDLSYSDDKFQVEQIDTKTHDTISAKKVDDTNIEENFNYYIDAVDEENDVLSNNEEGRKDQNFKDSIEPDLHKDEVNKIEDAVAVAGSGNQINKDEENSMLEIHEEDTSKITTQDDLGKNQKDAFVIPEVGETITKEYADDPVHSEEKQSVDQEKKEEFDFSYTDEKIQGEQTNTEIHDTIITKTVDDNNIEENFKDSIDAPKKEEKMGQISEDNTESDVHKDEDHKVEAKIAPASTGDHTTADEEVEQIDTKTHDTISAKKVDDTNIEENFNYYIDAVDEENDVLSNNEEGRKDQNFKDSIEPDLHKDEVNKIEDAVAVAGSGNQINKDEENSMLEIHEEDTSKITAQDDLGKNQKDAFVIPQVGETITKEYADDPVHSEEKQSVDQEKKEEFDFSYTDEKIQGGQTNTEVHDTITTKTVDENNIEENFKDSIDAPKKEEKMGQISEDNMESDVHKDEDHKVEANIAPASTGDHTRADEEISMTGADKDDASALTTQNDPEKNEKNAFVIPQVHETCTKESADDSVHFEEEKKSVYEEKNEEFDSSYSDDKLQVGQTTAETQNIIPAKTVDGNNIEENFDDSIDAVSEKSDAPNNNEEEMIGQNSKDIIETNVHKDEDHKVEVATASSGVYEEMQISRFDIDEEEASKLILEHEMEKNEKDTILLPKAQELSESVIDEAEASKSEIKEDVQKNEKEVPVLLEVQYIIDKQSVDDSVLIDVKKQPVYEENEELGNNAVDFSHHNDRLQVGTTHAATSEMVDGESIKGNSDCSIDTVGEKYNADEEIKESGDSHYDNEGTEELVRNRTEIHEDESTVCQNMDMPGESQQLQNIGEISNTGNQDPQINFDNSGDSEIIKKAADLEEFKEKFSKQSIDSNDTILDAELPLEIVVQENHNEIKEDSEFIEECTVGDEQENQTVRVSSNEEQKGIDQPTKENDLKHVNETFKEAEDNQIFQEDAAEQTPDNIAENDMRENKSNIFPNEVPEKITVEHTCNPTEELHENNQEKQEISFQKNFAEMHLSYEDTLGGTETENGYDTPYTEHGQVKEANFSSYRSSEIADSELREEASPYQRTSTSKEGALSKNEDCPRNKDATAALSEEHILHGMEIKEQSDMISHVELPTEIFTKEDNKESGDVESHSAGNSHNEESESVHIIKTSSQEDENHEQNTERWLKTNKVEEQEEDNRVNLEMKIERRNTKSTTEEEQLEGQKPKKPMELVCDKQEQEGREIIHATIEDNLQTNRDEVLNAVNDLDPVNHNNEQTRGSDVPENILKQEKTLQTVDSNEEKEETQEEKTGDLLVNIRSVENDIEASNQHTENLESDKLEKTANFNECKIWHKEDASGIVASDKIKIEQSQEIPHRKENVEQGINVELKETNADETPNDKIGEHDSVRSEDNFLITGLAEELGVKSVMNVDQNKNLDDSSTKMQRDVQVKHDDISEFTDGECPQKDIQHNKEILETNAIDMMPKDGKSVDNIEETEDLPEETMSLQCVADNPITIEGKISQLPSEESNIDVRVKVLAEYPSMDSNKDISKEEPYFSPEKTVKEEMPATAQEEQKKDSLEEESPEALTLESARTENDQQPNLDDLPVSRFLMEKILREEYARVEKSPTTEYEERLQEDNIGEQHYDNSITQGTKIKTFSDEEVTKDTEISGNKGNTDHDSRVLMPKEIIDKKTENAVTKDDHESRELIREESIEKKAEDAATKDDQTTESNTLHRSPESKISGDSEIKPSCLQSKKSTQATSNDKTSKELDYEQDKKIPEVCLERITGCNIQEDMKSLDMETNSLSVVNEPEQEVLLEESTRSFEEEDTNVKSPNTVLGEQKTFSELLGDEKLSDHRGSSLDFLSTQCGDFHAEHEILGGTPEIKSTSEIKEKGTVDEEEIIEIPRQFGNSNINEESKVFNGYEVQQSSALEQHEHIQVDGTLLQNTTVNVHEKGTSEKEANNNEGIIESRTQYWNRDINQEFKAPDEIQQSDVTEQYIKESFQVEEEGDTSFGTQKKGVEEEKDEHQEEEKLDDEKGNKEEEDEHEQEHEVSNNQPVTIVGVRDTDSKPSHKKSHNILSGMGSKVKHSLAKVKKVITGKSSHAKTISTQQEKPPVNTI